MNNYTKYVVADFAIKLCALCSLFFTARDAKNFAKVAII